MVGATPSLKGVETHPSMPFVEARGGSSTPIEWKGVETSRGGAELGRPPPHR
jgi:hypothetical protein